MYSVFNILCPSDGRTDGQADGRTDGQADKAKPVYPSFKFIEAGGIMKFRFP